MKDIDDKFYDLIKGFDTAMLCTRSADDVLRARPMAIASAEHNCNLWFFTSVDTPKVDEILQDPAVVVTLQKGSQFLSLSGHANVVRDRAKIEELWSEPYKVWFPEGKADPRLCLIELVTHEGEYWDNAGVNKLKYMFKAAKAYLMGETPKNSPEEHGTLVH